MKRLLAVLLALAACLTFSPPAQAGWHWDPLKWEYTRFSSGSATTFTLVDTTFAALGATDDTTSWFTVPNADPFLGTGSASDTVAVAYLVIVADSSVTVAETTTNMTVTFQAAGTNTNALLNTATGTSVLNATTIGTSICVATSGDRAFVFPLPVAQRGPSGANGDLLPVLATGQNVRAITTTVVGGGVHMARAFLVWWSRI